MNKTSHEVLIQLTSFLVSENRSFCDNTLVSLVCDLYSVTFKRDADKMTRPLISDMKGSILFQTSGMKEGIVLCVSTVCSRSIYYKGFTNLQWIFFLLVCSFGLKLFDLALMFEFPPFLVISFHIFELYSFVVFVIVLFYLCGES